MRALIVDDEPVGRDCIDGFEVIERVGVDRMPPVLFITAYHDNAARAFELHALDYVLTPFTGARFHDALRHARLRLATDQAAATPPNDGT